MRKYAIVAAGLLLSLVLGATLFREPIAWAAQSVDANIIGPLDGNGNVKVHEQGTAAVHEQGTANVNVTNSSLSITLPPVTGGGERVILGLGAGDADRFFATPRTATALSYALTDAVDSLTFWYHGSEVAAFWGTTWSASDDVNLALTRPITFDEIRCSVNNPGFDGCLVSWIGAAP